MLEKVLKHNHGGNYKETAGDKPEEGGDDVKSSWPLRLGLKHKMSLMDDKGDLHLIRYGYITQ